MIGHYARRFFTSLSRRPPSPVNEQWVASIVPAAELALFTRLSNTDRRHLIHSARLMELSLDPDDDRVWIRVSLLHDVGKFDARLGVFGRVLATMLAMTVGDERVRGWAGRPGWRGRLGTYQTHDEIGAAQIRAVGGPEAAAVWSQLHHRPERFASSSIPMTYLVRLDAADH